MDRRRSQLEGVGGEIEVGVEMFARRPTITDVARLAGVSIKTVSRVLNDEPHVRPSTREKVVAAADTLSFLPNQSARQLASKLTYVLAMLYDYPNSAYSVEVQQGSLDACRENGYHLLIHPCETDSANLIREVVGLHRQVDGMILLQPVSDNQQLCQTLLESQIECVRVSQRPFTGMSWISVGDSEAAGEMTEYLLKLGHRRIGFIIGHPEHGQSHDRLTGYRNALQRHDIDFDATLVEQGQFDFESGCACTRKLLSLRQRPTAIFASNDSMAMGVLSVAHEMGLDVPRELSVTGFDDSPLARYAWPPLTTVHQPIVEVARIATELLLRQLQGRSDNEFEHRLQANLVIRKSTASPA